MDKNDWDDDPRWSLAGRPPEKKEMLQTKHVVPAYMIILLLVALVLPVYIWLARFLWEWALG